MKISILVLTLFIILSCNQKNSNNIIEENNESVKEIVPGRYNVAFLIMEGVFNTELTAPYDIFHHTIFRDSIKSMNVFTVANTKNSIHSFEGLTIVPDFDYLNDELPTIDILVIPSAENHLGSDLKDTTMLNFVRKIAHEAKYVTSHCDGAFVLAEANLLENKVSTTFPNDIEEMRRRYPSLDIRDDVLFVHDGKYITSAGGAKSFEAALYLCELLYGKKNTDEIAEGMVIDWSLNKLNYVVIEN